MFKKSLVAALCVVAVALVASCAAKYADVAESLGKMTAATETLVADLDKAADAKAVATAITAYTTVFNAEGANTKALIEKYPELKDLQEPPVELKDAYAKLNASSEKLAAAMIKVQAYALDPEVMAAMAALTGETAEAAPVEAAPADAAATEVPADAAAPSASAAAQ